MRWGSAMASSEWAEAFQKTKAAFNQVAANEGKLDERIARARPWSETWWHLLNQINVTRSQMIYLRNLAAKIERMAREERERFMNKAEGA